MREKVGCLPHSSSFFEVKEKIVTQRVNSSMKLIAAYDDGKNYFLDTTNVSNYETWDQKTPMKFLCGLLNSNLINFYYCFKYRMPTIGGYELHSIPIIKPDERNQKEITTIVDRILAITKDADYLVNPAKQAQTREYEKKIDQKVYDLYGLTEEEIRIVEGETK